jgi:nitrogen fixation NifU-like protein
MDELRDLYQATILDHNKKPRNFGALSDANHTADGHNPLCGDKITVYVKLNSDGVAEAVSFDGAGCAISTASASLMTDFIKGANVTDIDQVFERFHALVTSNPSEPPDIDGLGKLAVFSGVREFPMRVKCATLCWHTLQAALNDSNNTARTE